MGKLAWRFGLELSLPSIREEPCGSDPGFAPLLTRLRSKSRRLLW